MMASVQLYSLLSRRTSAHVYSFRVKRNKTGILSLPQWTLLKKCRHPSNLRVTHTASCLAACQGSYNLTDEEDHHSHRQQHVELFPSALVLTHRHQYHPSYQHIPPTAPSLHSTTSPTAPSSYRTISGLPIHSQHFVSNTYSVFGCYSSLPVLAGGQQVSWLHTTGVLCLPDKKSKHKAVIEKAVDTLKEKKKKVAEVVAQESAVTAPKPSIARRIWNEVVHYYHGFRLLVLDIRVAFRLLWKTLRGYSLTRRELKQFRRTTGDIFRVVPFSVFIVIPFMEFLLPVYLWLFPNALPSTFQSKSSKDARKKKELQVKLQMAKFLQDTIEEMAVSSKHPKKDDSVREFASFFEKIRTSGEQASTEEIMKFSKLFEDELTLDNLSRPQLTALCRLLLLQPFGTNNFLRFQLRMKLRQLKADDQLIQKEGVDSLTVAELQAACQARGMRALGMPEDRLRSQLQQWLDIHLNQEIPVSLLLLSRALYLPEDIPTTDALKETLSKLPETIVEEAEVLVADTSGESVDNKIRLEVLRQQEQLIIEEAKEKERALEEQKAAQAAESARVASEEMIDQAHILTTSVPAPETTATVSSSPPSGDAVSPQTEPVADEAMTEKESISVEEIRGLSQVVSTFKDSRALEEDMEELKEERGEYCEDVADLAEECKDELVESKGSARLGRRVEAMISKMDQALTQLNTEISGSSESATLQRLHKEGSDVITTAQLEEALMTLMGASSEAKIRSLVRVLDKDHDGNINLEEMANVIESLALEDTDIKAEHIDQITELFKKEVTLESSQTTTPVGTQLQQ